MAPPVTMCPGQLCFLCRVGSNDSHFAGVLQRSALKKASNCVSKGEYLPHTNVEMGPEMLLRVTE